MELQHNQAKRGNQNVYEKHVVGVPISSQDYHNRRYSITSFVKPLLPHQRQIMHSPSKHYSKITHNRVNSAITKLAKLRERVDIFAQGIRDHVQLGPKLSKTLKGKLRLGARILQVGGVQKVFKNNFNIIDGEKLVTASQCYLSTTAGPIAGLLFVSSQRIAFCSDRSIKLSSPDINGNHLLKLHYKVMIPLRKIKRAIESENVKKPRQKYVEIVTYDNFEFWFMGFLNHQTPLRNLQQAIHQDFWATEIV